MAFWEVLTDILILLAAALVLGAFFERIRQSAILGYLLAGLLLGPGTFGVVKGDEEVIGGFDLIHKGKEVTLPEASQYTSMLGCKLNRMENMRKLARSCAYRLSK